MGRGTEEPSSRFPNRAWIAFVITAIVGVAVSIYLTGVHVVVTYAGEQVEGLCNLSAKINCNVAAGSSYSEVGGVPIALLGMGFYLGALAILITYKKTLDKWAPSLLMALFVGAVIYSLFLAFISAFILRSFCWACTTLYLVNIVGLVLSRALSAKPYSKTLGDLLRNISQIAPSPSAIAFIAVLVVGTGGGYAIAHQVGKGMEKTDGERVAEAEAWVKEAFLQTPKLSADKIAELHKGPAKGAEGEAAVVIAEFSDFECPFCSRVAPDLMKLVKDPFYKDHVKIHFRQNPLDMACNPRLTKPFHRHACTGAKVALCAGEQNKFWEMHDQLFANRTKLAAEHIPEHAKALNLNVKELRDCVASDRPGEIIKADIELAKRVGVRGTPTIFINGRLVKGAVPYWKLKAAVDHELKEKGIEVPAPAPAEKKAPAP